MLPALATPIYRLLRRPDSNRDTITILFNKTNQSAKITMFCEYYSQCLLKAFIVATHMK